MRFSKSSTLPGIELSLLKAAAQRAFEQNKKDPGLKLLDVVISVSETPRFETFEPVRTYRVRLKTNDEAMASGSEITYKGSYQQRIEGVLSYLIGEQEPLARVRVEFDGPSGEVEKFVPLSYFEKDFPKAPIVETAKRNNIPHILIRGRHLIAPSPAMESFFAQYLVGFIGTAIDFFGGTGLTPAILAARDCKSVTVIDQDPTKIEAMKTYLGQFKNVSFEQADALTFPLTSQYDLAVADPYYEDSNRFLEEQGLAIREHCKRFVFVPGDIEDVIWNSRIRSMLEEQGWAIQDHEYFGQVIFSCE